MKLETCYLFYHVFILIQHSVRCAFSNPCFLSFRPSIWTETELQPNRKCQIKIKPKWKVWNGKKRLGWCCFERKWCCHQQKKFHFRLEVLYSLSIWFLLAVADLLTHRNKQQKKKKKDNFLFNPSNMNVLKEGKVTLPVFGWFLFCVQKNRWAFEFLYYCKNVCWFQLPSTYVCGWVWQLVQNATCVHFMNVLLILAKCRDGCNTNVTLICE